MRLMRPGFLVKIRGCFLMIQVLQTNRIDPNFENKFLDGFSPCDMPRIVKASPIIEKASSVI
jgi:hypothetical protein